MLTEQERKWLEERTPVCCELLPPKSFDGYPQSRCPDCKYNLPHGQCSIYRSDYRDAAEFEARVAVVAANGAQPCLQYDYNCPYGYAGDCPDNCDGNYNRFGTQATRCGLKHARLYVEQEMDNDTV